MPCYVDPPTNTELYRHATAKRLHYANSSLGRNIPDELDRDAEFLGGKDYTQELCALLQNLTTDEMDRVVYNAKSKDARALADWWEKHQADDARHEQERRDADAKFELAIDAWKKLSPDERRALNVAKPERRNIR